MTHELLDIEAARQHVRLQLAALDGSPIREALECLTRHLADQVAARPGRDLEAAGDVLLEAASCLATFYLRNPGLPPTACVNVLGITGVELAARAHDTPPQPDIREGTLRLMAGMLTQAETDARRYRLAWLSARRSRRSIVDGDANADTERRT